MGKNDQKKKKQESNKEFKKEIQRRRSFKRNSKEEKNKKSSGALGIKVAIISLQGVKSGFFSASPISFERGYSPEDKINIPFRTLNGNIFDKGSKVVAFDINEYRGFFFASSARLARPGEFDKKDLSKSS